MTTWSEFTEQAPTIAAVFTRRHRATGNLCMLATLRADGSPRISPLEPRIFEDDLVLAGMPNTTKFHDLSRDPRFCLHTATVDTMVGDGDAKLFGAVTDNHDESLHRRFAQSLFDETGFDIRDQKFDHYYIAALTGASTVEVIDDHLLITIWTPGRAEHVVQKH
ncbi:pyridoxamine 5'-phosphate oxidase family protein [Nocardia bovistercoris]|uniref:Pyridoxamine 5'-phosphate oxidase family protein n=1 Tax=Nocardia bovistercoris TaxID=2785916 RepID=A0A931IF07_9NOCA|nr:pyridoxamine 5'-phosphate oxidase family protein [Nocardia bovistercoris]MBH0780294.1 pyridoxamine 5'-phosphate oxidase family protein [Nocardia bovistercoris]